MVTYSVFNKYIDRLIEKRTCMDLIIISDFPPELWGVTFSYDWRGIWRGNYNHYFLVSTLAILGQIPEYLWAWLSSTYKIAIIIILMLQDCFNTMVNKNIHNFLSTFESGIVQSSWNTLSHLTVVGSEWGIIVKTPGSVHSTVLHSHPWGSTCTLMHSRKCIIKGQCVSKCF